MNKIFLDTNVLVSAIDTTRKNHKKAIKLIERIKNSEYQAFISTQIIGEFYVVLTRKLGGIKAPLTPKEAKKEINDLFSSGILTILPVTETILRKSISLSAERNIKGIKFWDVVIVATMLENDILTIYTENSEDFKKFSDLITVEDLN